MASKLTVAFLVVASLALASSRTVQRVVGGEEATPHEFPYQLSLQWNYGPEDKAPLHFCGASLLNENFLMTAAHCDLTLSDDGFIEVVAGDHNVEVHEGTEQRRRVASIKVHPGYLSRVSANDIAVIRVDQPFELNDMVQVIQLPKQLEQFEGDVTLSGWGSISTGFTPEYPAELMKVVLPLVDYDTCYRLWEPTSATPYLEETNVCAGALDGSNAACSADSGGPLVKKLDDGVVVQVGIVSWGAVPCGQRNRPTVFTGVAHFIDWIEEQLRQDV